MSESATGSQIFFAHDQSRYINALGHVPGSVQTMTLHHLKDYTPPHTIDETGLERWFNNDLPHEECLQLIVSPGYLSGQPVPDQFQILPFSAKLFGIIMEEFQLPAATPWLIRTRTTHFQRYRYGSTKAPIFGFTMRFTTRGILWMDVALSISCNPASRFTRVFLHGCNPRQQEYIQEQLKTLTPLVHHPLLLPVILAHMKYELIADEARGLWQRLLTVENMSGLTGAPAIRYHRPKGELDFESLTKYALGVVQVSGGVRNHADTLLLMLESIQKSLQLEREEPSMAYLKEVADIFFERVDLIKHMTQVVRSDLSFFETRGEAQVSAIYNLIAQKNAEFSSQIARESRRDSSAMKSIAILTMLFLPATFLATVFAMPWFDFSASSGLSIKRKFWIYWVVTIVLTVVVLCIYFGYVGHVESKHKE